MALRLLTIQKLQARKMSFARRQAVVDLRRVVAHHESVCHQLALDGFNGAQTRGSVPGRKPTCGMSSNAASSCSDP